MLVELHITEFALVDDLRAQFGPGLNVLTGETGAGKSIIIGALGALLGVRADYDLIRSGASRAVIEAQFDLAQAPEAQATADSLGTETADGVLVVTRELHAGGKSQCRLNGRLATVSMLRDLGRCLVDVHGQHEHQTLLSVPRHLDLLDAWAGAEVQALRARVAETYRQASHLQEQLQKATTDARDRARQIDLYQFQLQEIEAAKLQPGEDEALESERLRLSNAEKLALHAEQAYALLRDDAGILDALASCETLLEALLPVDRSVAGLLDPIQSARYQLEEVARELRSYRESIEFNPERLDEVQARLETIQLLKRKYGDTVAEILAYRDTLAQDIDQLVHFEEREAELRTRYHRAQQELEELAKHLSQLRKQAVDRFQECVETELSALAMERTRFRVGMEQVSLASTGVDRVEFLLSANPGEPLKPLARTASGGELSRIMLALKTVLANVDPVPTLVFDEIDSGIGGRTARVIAQRLAALGKQRQVICVTHLPQIASYAEVHFTVRKEVEGDRTVVRLHRLDGEERVEELARMLGGHEDSATARRHARELLARAGTHAVAR